jgi:hypothetical protein
MIDFNPRSGSPSQLAHDAESWLRSLPSFDAGDALERVGSEVADLVPGRRRSRRWPAWAGWALPAVVATIAVATIATLWLLTHRSPTADRYGLEGMVPDADFDRDAGIRAASEGMQAPDQAGTPADDANLGAL